LSAHAEVRCAINQRYKREHLCRITRPAIANERLTRNRAGDVVLQLESPYHDGTTQIVMAALEFMQRLAALVPRPRLHLIRFHGVLAPNAKLRPEIVPSAPVNATNTAAGHRNTAPPSGPARISLSPAAQTGVRYRHGTLSWSSGGTLKIIAAIEHPPVIAKILTHLGLPAWAPPRSPARHAALRQTA
jgi:hypothetical protein